MTKLTFTEQIKHPEWQKRRLHMLEAANWQCTHCGTKEITLNVHHRRYVKGRLYWEYSDSELQVLCEGCHSQEHQVRDLLDKLLLINPDVLTIAVGFLGGFLEGEMLIEKADYQAALELSEPWVDLGLLASIMDGQYPDAFHRAVTSAGVTNLNSAQEFAVENWQDFAQKLERSGL